MNAELNLVVKRPEVPVDHAVIPTIKHLGQACQKCQEAAALMDKSLCIEMGIDNALWTRIKSGDAGVKGDFLDRLMDTCGNEIPLMWINWKRGYDFLPRRRETELERENRELREALERQQLERDVIVGFIRDSGRAIS